MQTLYFGGDIITMKEEHDETEAVLVKDGEIAFVGSLEETQKRCAADVKKIDLKGQTLMPAFIDSHGHISTLAQFSFFCNLSKCTCFEDIVQTLKIYKEENEIDENGVIFGYAYDHNFLEEHAHPTKELLDTVASTIPIFIFHTSAHMGVANSVLLELSGLTKDTPDPAGGRLGRTADGELTGYAEETPAFIPIIMKAYERVKGDFAKQILSAQQIYLSNGITTVQDGATSYQVFMGLAQIAQAGLFNIDVVAYIMTDEMKQTLQSCQPYFKQYQNHLKFDGSKIILDGSPQGRTAWLSKPYEGEDEFCAYPTHTDEEVEEAVTEAVRGKYQILAHCNGDAASQQFITSYEKALAKVEDADTDLRPVMIHCQTVRDDQLDEMAKMNMIPSIFVSHTYYWGDIHLANLGPERGNRISPVKSALDRGLVYNFHSDPPVLVPNMLESVWCAVNRKTRSGVAIGEDQKIGVYDALKGITINGAYSYHEENTKGTIETGKLADLVILDQNPLKITPERINEIKVIETIKQGNTVYQC